jgi:hypothetical protein
MKIKILIATIFTIISCNRDNCNWQGGQIIEFGEYCDGELKIKVYQKNNDLHYEMRNSRNEVLVKQDMSISIYQHWGLFLDNKKNFWLLSSDVGIYVWEKDSVSGRYRKRTFFHKLRKDQVPPELYNSSLKRFL